jgi:hypothetical protein
LLSLASMDLPWLASEEDEGVSVMKQILTGRPLCLMHPPALDLEANARNALWWASQPMQANSRVDVEPDGAVGKADGDGSEMVDMPRKSRRVGAVILRAKEGDAQMRTRLMLQWRSVIMLDPKTSDAGPR